MFEEFWKLYPRKVSKRVAQAAFNKMPKQDQEAALEALPVHIRYWQLKETATEFIPHASTWLNQRRWEDEVVIYLDEKPKELPLGTEKQIEEAYRIECGGDPTQARFGSYFEMKKFI